jgi:hypothetical protein
VTCARAANNSVIHVAEKLLLRIPHFRHPWRSAEKLLLRIPHFRHPWRSAGEPTLRLSSEGSLIH